MQQYLEFYKALYHSKRLGRLILNSIAKERFRSEIPHRWRSGRGEEKKGETAVYAHGKCTDKGASSLNCL
ncbi:hypothetical protein EON65_25390 [archaeon]|nr:MAG: hypothetical protein EON65_25390 [archaeon]